MDGPELGAGWRRAFRFRVPVREPDLWNSDAVQNALVPTLSFLPDDEYAFEFVRLEKDPPLGPFIDYDETPFDGEVAEVVSFSGGLDSLAGAVTEAVVGRRQVLLVHHRSTSKFVPQHERLVRALQERAGDRAPVHFSVRANRSAAVGDEYTQRTRSFLFAALGVLFARMIGLDRFRFYENGVVSLNLPPSPQVVGARASRTTHPRALGGFGRLFSALLGRRFVVDNPFLWDTKTDVVRRIATAECAGLIGLSRSCAQTIALESRTHSHCGVCSQCIDRRFTAPFARWTPPVPSGYVLPRALVEWVLSPPRPFWFGHHCGACGLSVPLSLAPSSMPNPPSDLRAFPACPACGGVTSHAAGHRPDPPETGGEAGP